MFMQPGLNKWINILFISLCCQSYFLIQPHPGSTFTIHNTHNMSFVCKLKLSYSCCFTEIVHPNLRVHPTHTFCLHVYFYYSLYLSFLRKICTNHINLFFLFCPKSEPIIHHILKYKTPGLGPVSSGDAYSPSNTTWHDSNTISSTVAAIFHQTEWWLYRVFF